MKETSWAMHTEFVVLLVTLLGGFYLLDTKIERQSDRIDRNSESQSARSDRLYEMFIELLRERK